jgi:four helix bundle protein
MRHEQTIVYQKCLALMETAQQTIEQFPSGFAFLADQLRRNTSSVAHNFAEGYYQDSRRQQRRFFGYAIQSAREASTSFDTARAFHAARERTVEVGKALALELVRMISKFDGGRGRQDSETGLRQQAAGARTQAAGNRLQAIRPAQEDCEP